MNKERTKKGLRPSEFGFDTFGFTAKQTLD